MVQMQFLNVQDVNEVSGGVSSFVDGVETVLKGLAIVGGGLIGEAIAGPVGAIAGGIAADGLATAAIDNVNKMGG
jgi:hypothetical protein